MKQFTPDAVKIKTLEEVTHEQIEGQLLTEKI
jgi:hypothetical protein